MKNCSHAASPIKKKIFISFLICVSLLILFANRIFAEGIDKHGEISKLIEQLASEPDGESAELLSQYGEKALIPLAEAIKTNKIALGSAKSIFWDLISPEAMKEVAILLTDNDIRICGLAAESLKKHGDASAVPALTNALHRFRKARIDGKVNARTFPPDGRISMTEWDIAGALWKLGEKTQAAREILEHARICEQSRKYELFGMIDSPVARQFMPEKERLDFLLNYKIVRTVHLTLPFDVSLSSSKKQLLPEDEDSQLLKKYRKEVLAIMRKRLHKKYDSAAAALTLGYLKDTESLPMLRHLLIHSADGYGWETDFPDDLAYHEYPNYHSYEEAIKHISGKSLEEAITLTPEETRSLLHRYHNGDASALYILFRFLPDTARLEASHKFKKTGKEELRVGLCTIMARHFLKTGFSKQKVKELLGKPDMVLADKSRSRSQQNQTLLGKPNIFSENKWGYICESLQDDYSWKRGILLTFDNDKIAEIQLTRNIIRFFIKKQENDK